MLAPLSCSPTPDGDQTTYRKDTGNQDGADHRAPHDELSQLRQLLGVTVAHIDEDRSAQHSQAQHKVSGTDFFLVRKVDH